MNSAAKVDVVFVSDEDIPDCFTVLSKGFGDAAPFVNIYFPLHDTPSGHVQGSKRLLTWKQTDHDSTFLKAVTRTGPNDQERIIGFGVWTHMKEAPNAKLDEVEDVEEVWPDPEDREYMTQLWRDYVGPRSQAVNDSGGKGVYVLELLVVHPDFQRLGAGTALVKWGTHAADDQGLRAIVEGTPVGRHLYEKCGLHAEIERMSFDVGDRFVRRRKPELIFMTRDPVSS
ncbi:hypothetical protein F4677DRAFT_398136 [Hypoxylon crocopeplum]|nr:hypothetical protein F4677DRAFT_398136 [Hypoxylon crocopeplum]